MNLKELLEVWRCGRATVTFDEAYPALHGMSRASFYRMAAAGELPGVLRLGRKRLLSLGVYLEFLGVPREAIWVEESSVNVTDE